MEDPGPADGESEGECSCKIGRAVRTYDLGAFDRTLIDRRRDGASLRDLETVVNEAVLRAALREADADVIGDVSSVYEGLAGDEASAGERAELRDRLARAGVDVDELEADFVSYQTVRTHFRECLDVDTDRQASLSVEDARGTVEWARSRSEGIVERTLDRLARTDGFTAGDVSVSHVVRVTCDDCGASYPVDAFVDRGGCDCSTADSDGS
ncbi:rod-determining factor RdfA [Halosimplex salinum]|uniref:rod-determining factor RdfA n=1 Tax=Halosimplex salinum TaxID=1710538 RepID=UPI000F483608|nr:rod-determining factor RdfA [Halosimplex salinum]